MGLCTPMLFYNVLFSGNEESGYSDKSEYHTNNTADFFDQSTFFGKFGVFISPSAQKKMTFLRIKKFYGANQINNDAEQNDPYGMAYYGFVLADLAERVA